MKVAVVGAGYVGLVSGLVLFEQGHDVLFVDRDEARCLGLSQSRVPFVEPGVDELLTRANASGRVRFTSAFDDVNDCVLALVCVPTPSSADASLDTDAVFAVGDVLADLVASADSALRGVFVRSTCPPGTARALTARLAGRRPAGAPAVHAGALPEFLREGSALADHRDPDRVVVGTDDLQLRDLARQLYPATHAFFDTTPESAELLKLASNAWLATCISFSNEVARVAERLEGVDADVVFRGLHLDRRLARPEPAGIVAYLVPGAGFGGSCLGKDTRALTAFAQKLGEPASVLDAVSRVNDGQPLRLVARLDERLGGLRGRRILVLGLAFKAGTDDVRSSIAVPVVEALVAGGGRVVVHDPLALDAFLAILPERVRAGVQRADGWHAHLRDADAVVVLTAADEYVRELPETLRSTPHDLVLVDGRSLFRAAGFPPRITYVGVGLGPSENTGDESRPA